MPPHRDPSGKYLGQKFDPNFVDPRAIARQQNGGQLPQRDGPARPTHGHGGQGGAQHQRGPLHGPPMQQRTGGFGTGASPGLHAVEDHRYGSRAVPVISTPNRGSPAPSAPVFAPAHNGYGRMQQNGAGNPNGGHGNGHGNGNGRGNNGNGTGNGNGVEVPTDRPPPPVNFVTGRNKGKGNPNSVNWSQAQNNVGINTQSVTRDYAQGAPSQQNGYSPHQGQAMNRPGNDPYHAPRPSFGTAAVPHPIQQSFDQPRVQSSPASAPPARSTGVHPSRLAQVPYVDVVRSAPTRSEYTNRVHVPEVSTPIRRNDRPAPLSTSGEQYQQAHEGQDGLRSGSTSAGTGLTAMANRFLQSDKAVPITPTTRSVLGMSPVNGSGQYQSGNGGLQAQTPDAAHIPSGPAAMMAPVTQPSSDSSAVGVTATLSTPTPGLKKQEELRARLMAMKKRNAAAASNNGSRVSSPAASPAQHGMSGKGSFLAPAVVETAPVAAPKTALSADESVVSSTFGGVLPRRGVNQLRPQAMQPGSRGSQDATGSIQARTSGNASVSTLGFTALPSDIEDNADDDMQIETGSSSDTPPVQHTTNMTPSNKRERENEGPGVASAVRGVKTTLTAERGKDSEREEGEIESSGPTPKRARPSELQDQQRTAATVSGRSEIGQTPTVSSSTPSTAASGTGTSNTDLKRRPAAADFISDKPVKIVMDLTPRAQEHSRQHQPQRIRMDEEDHEEPRKEKDPEAQERARQWKERQVKAKAEDIARVQAQLEQTKRNVAAMQARQAEERARARAQAEQQQKQQTGPRGRGEKNAVYRGQSDVRPVEANERNGEGNGNGRYERHDNQERQVRNGHAERRDSGGRRLSLLERISPRKGDISGGNAEPAYAMLPVFEEEPHERQDDYRQHIIDGHARDAHQIRPAAPAQEQIRAPPPPDSPYTAAHRVVQAEPASAPAVAAPSLTMAQNNEVMETLALLKAQIARLEATLPGGPATITAAPVAAAPVPVNIAHAPIPVAAPVVEPPARERAVSGAVHPSRLAQVPNASPVASPTVARQAPKPDQNGRYHPYERPQDRHWNGEGNDGRGNVRSTGPPPGYGTPVRDIDQEYQNDNAARNGYDRQPSSSMGVQQEYGLQPHQQVRRESFASTGPPASYAQPGAGAANQAPPARLNFVTSKNPYHRKLPDGRVDDRHHVQGRFPPPASERGPDYDDGAAFRFSTSTSKIAMYAPPPLPPAPVQAPPVRDYAGAVRGGAKGRIHGHAHGQTGGHGSAPIRASNNGYEQRGGYDQGFVPQTVQRGGGGGARGGGRGGRGGAAGRGRGASRGGRR